MSGKLNNNYVVSFEQELRAAFLKAGGVQRTLTLLSGFQCNQSAAAINSPSESSVLASADLLLQLLTIDPSAECCVWSPTSLSVTSQADAAQVASERASANKSDATSQDSASDSVASDLVASKTAFSSIAVSGCIDY